MHKQATAQYRSIKRAQSRKIKECLSETEELTERQVDMVAAAIMTMPDSTISAIITQLEEDPESILDEIMLSEDDD